MGLWHRLLGAPESTSAREGTVTTQYSLQGTLTSEQYLESRVSFGHAGTHHEPSTVVAYALFRISRLAAHLETYEC